MIEGSDHDIARVPGPDRWCWTRGLERRDRPGPVGSTIPYRRTSSLKRAASLRGQWKYCDLGESSHRFAQTRYPRGHFASSGSKRLLGARLAELNRPGAMCLGRIVPRTFAWLPKTLLRPCFITTPSHIRRSSCDLAPS